MFITNTLTTFLNLFKLIGLQKNLQLKRRRHLSLL